MKLAKLAAALAPFVVIVSMSALSSKSQPAKANLSPAELKEAIIQVDKAMFDAFNAHNVDLLTAMFADDIEFYHDKSGLTNLQQSREGFVKMFENTPDIRRELVKDSLQIFPIKDYGAIEIGSHRFCHKENGVEQCGEFPFLMIWRQVSGDWKVSRVVSYGH